MRATAVRVTDRGKEFCEDVRKRWVCPISLPRLFSLRPARLRAETLYEADALGEWAADHEASPEDGAEVDGELGHGSLSADQSALEDKTPDTYSPFPVLLMELVVDESNMSKAWSKVKANKGAPGPDGITLEVFFETFRHQWPSVRQALVVFLTGGRKSLYELGQFLVG